MTRANITAGLLIMLFWPAISFGLTPVHVEHDGKFCIPLAVSPTRDAISFVRRYKINAERNGIKKTDIEVIRDDNYFLVTSTKSLQQTHEMAAEQLSMGLIKQVYRLEEKFVGSKTLYIFNPEAAELIYGDGKKHYLHKKFRICLGTRAKDSLTVTLDPLVSTKTEHYLLAKFTQFSFLRAQKKEKEDALLNALPPGIID